MKGTYRRNIRLVCTGFDVTARDDGEFGQCNLHYYFAVDGRTRVEGLTSVNRLSPRLGWMD